MHKHFTVRFSVLWFTIDYHIPYIFAWKTNIFMHFVVLELATHENLSLKIIASYLATYPETTSWLVCGSGGVCLDCTWPGFKSPLGWDFFCVQVI